MPSTEQSPQIIIVYLRERHFLAGLPQSPYLPVHVIEISFQCLENGRGDIDFLCGLQGAYIAAVHELDMAVESVQGGVCLVLVVLQSGRSFCIRQMPLRNRLEQGRLLNRLWAGLLRTRQCQYRYVLRILRAFSPLQIHRKTSACCRTMSPRRRQSSE